MTDAKVQLGRYLFFDKRLSINGTQACATCHQPRYAFTDKRGRAVGATGQLHLRGALSLTNVAYSAALTWENPTIRALEDQAVVPMFGTEPVEMGANEDAVARLLSSDRTYRGLLRAAYPCPKEKGSRIFQALQALACFERSLISGTSPYDRYHLGHDITAMSPAALRGEALFFNERLGCSLCHGGIMFMGDFPYRGHVGVRPSYYLARMHSPDWSTDGEAVDLGLATVTGAIEDVGKFKAPQLRNITVTAPYMHDGRFQTVEAVLSSYRIDERLPPLLKCLLMRAHDSYCDAPTLTYEECSDLLVFLQSLTDQHFLNNPDFSDPWSLPRGSSRTVARANVK